MTHDRADPVVVLLPGLGLDARAWEPVRQRLRDAARTVLLPSLGRWAPRTADLHVERQAQRLLDELVDDGAVVLVGHSASCAVAVELAATSTTVVGLVLVGPVTDPRAATWPRMLAQWLRTATHERLGEIPVLAPQYRRTGAVAILRGMDAVRRYRTDSVIARLDLPVVVLRGSHDRIAPHDWSSRLADLARGRLETVDGAAHMVPLTHPEAIAEAVRGVVAKASNLSP